MDHSLVIGWLAPGRRNHRGVSRNLSGEKIRAVRGPSRKISKFPKIQKMMAMANLPDFAKHREKRNFANRFIHSAERDSWRNRINVIPKRVFDHLLLVQRKGSAMASSVPVAPVIFMFTSLKWMRFERDFWELCPKAIVQKFLACPEG